MAACDKNSKVSLAKSTGGEGEGGRGGGGRGEVRV